MAEVPHLGEDSPTCVVAPSAGGRCVVSRSAAADVWDRSACSGEITLDVGERDLSSVTGHNAGLCQPLPGRVALVEENDGVKVVDHIFVATVLRPVAWNLEGTEASRVLGKFMRPQDLIRLVLVDPILGHVV